MGEPGREPGRQPGPRSLTVTPGPDGRTVRTADGRTLQVPEGWDLLPPGDAALTRRVKAAGPHWVVQETRGRRTFSRGVWAERGLVERIRGELEVERADPRHARRVEQGRTRRAREQEAYVGTFTGAVAAFLAFAPRHAELGEAVAEAIAAHATPVGSGTVARTRRIPVERRAEAATIAWLRHRTTGYDSMHVPRVRGMRREIRRMLAERSRELLGVYRRGEEVDPACCLLRRALGWGAGERG